MYNLVHQHGNGCSKCYYATNDLSLLVDENLESSSNLIINCKFCGTKYVLFKMPLRMEPIKEEKQKSMIHIVEVINKNELRSIGPAESIAKVFSKIDDETTTGDSLAKLSIDYDFVEKRLVVFAYNSDSVRIFRIF